MRGLNRLHQFEKVEIVCVDKPEKSAAHLDGMVSHVGSLLESLGLHYRVLRLCGGDLGFAASITYDFEVWSAAQERWLEVSSVSNFKTFQSSRLKLRYREDVQSKPTLCHTLNGSSLALPRVLPCWKTTKMPPALTSLMCCINTQDSPGFNEYDESSVGT